MRDDLLIGGQRNRHERIAVFAGKDFVIAYDYLGKTFELDTKDYTGCEMYWMSPISGVKSYIGRCNQDSFIATDFTKVEGDDTDRVLILTR